VKIIRRILSTDTIRWHPSVKWYSAAVTDNRNWHELSWPPTVIFNNQM